MKRGGQAVALIAGVAVGLGGVALGLALSRREGREAAQRILAQSGGYRKKSMQVARTVAGQTAKVGGQLAKTATEQYQAQAPRAREAFSAVAAQAPQAREALAGVLSRNA